MVSIGSDQPLAFAPPFRLGCRDASLLPLAVQGRDKAPPNLHPPSPLHSHHACRTYVCFDVLRRIMRDHFGYRVTLIMNITDIDDKIIARANEAGRPFNELAAE